MGLLRWADIARLWIFGYRSSPRILHKKTWRLGGSSSKGNLVERKHAIKFMHADSHKDLPVFPSVRKKPSAILSYEVIHQCPAPYTHLCTVHGQFQGTIQGCN